MLWLPRYTRGVAASSCTLVLGHRRLKSRSQFVIISYADKSDIAVVDLRRTCLALRDPDAPVSYALALVIPAVIDLLNRSVLASERRPGNTRRVSRRSRHTRTPITIPSGKQTLHGSPGSRITTHFLRFGVRRPQAYQQPTHVGRVPCVICRTGGACAAGSEALSQHCDIRQAGATYLLTHVMPG